MLLDTTVGNILRKSHKPAKAHRIPQNNQNFIMTVMNAEFTDTRNSVLCLAGKGKLKFLGMC